MDDRIDVSKRKPRQLRGTPALSFINRGSLIVLGVALAIGLLTTLPLNLVEDLRAKYKIDLVTVSSPERDRRTQFNQNLMKRRTGEEVLALIEENEKLKQK